MNDKISKIVFVQQFVKSKLTNVQQIIINQSYPLHHPTIQQNELHDLMLS